jgi:hypothetical protein
MGDNCIASLVGGEGDCPSQKQIFGIIAVCIICCLYSCSSSAAGAYKMYYQDDDGDDVNEGFGNVRYAYNTGRLWSGRPYH